MSLRENGRYFLPLEGRFVPDNYNFTARDSTLSLLSYDKLGHRYTAMVYWDMGLVVIDEWVIDRQAYAPRVVPIDDAFRLAPITATDCGAMSGIIDCAAARCSRSSRTNVLSSDSSVGKATV